MSDLPLCRWREDVGVAGVYKCNSPLLLVVGAVGDKECSQCPVVDKVPKERTKLKPQVCRWLGDATGALKECKSCFGRVQLKVYDCLFGLGNVTLQECSECIHFTSSKLDTGSEGGGHSLETAD